MQLPLLGAQIVLVRIRVRVDKSNISCMKSLTMACQEFSLASNMCVALLQDGVLIL